MAEPEKDTPLPPDIHPETPRMVVPGPNFEFIEEKVPEHLAMAKAAEHVAATEMKAEERVNAWLYVIAFILIFFMLAMVLLAAVVSSPVK